MNIGTIQARRYGRKNHDWDELIESKFNFGNSV